MKKLVFLTSLFCCAVLASGGGWTQAAEKYPSRPINFIVPLEAGGGGDVQTRPLAARLAELMGQAVVVVNKPGAGSSIGYRAIHDARPDGYTIGIGMATVVANKLQGLLPYDFREFTMLGAFQMAVPAVVAATKGQRNFKTMQEAIDYARAHPGEVSVASGGKGQTWWIGCQEFQMLAKAKFNVIPQEGAGGYSIAQVAGGHTDLGVLGLAEGKSQIDAGNARLLATFGDRRPFSYPNVPTLKELGYDVKVCSLVSAIGPPGMPKEVVAPLVKAIAIAAKEPDYRKFLEERNNTISLYYTPEEQFRKYMEQREVFRDVLDKAGLLKEK
jgi:tripartite-type tricarboxylate transporter receptor subunit TctC